MIYLYTYISYFALSFYFGRKCKPPKIVDKIIHGITLIIMIPVMIFADGFGTIKDTISAGNDKYVRVGTWILVITIAGIPYALWSKITGRKEVSTLLFFGLYISGTIILSGLNYLIQILQ